MIKEVSFHYDFDGRVLNVLRHSSDKYLPLLQGISISMSHAAATVTLHVPIYLPPPSRDVASRGPTPTAFPPVRQTPTRYSVFSFWEMCVFL